MIDITICNWEKYNPRNDLKTMNWFRIENRLPEHPAYFKLSTNGKWFFIWLLCQCAKQMKPSIKLELKYCVHYSGVALKEIPQILQVLHEHDLLRYGNVTSTYEKRPNERDKRTNIYKQKDLNKEFELIWNEYPRKKGKQEAFKYFTREYKKRDIVYLNEIKKSIKNYCEEIKHNGTEEKFIKHGSGFFNTLWKDYLQIETRGSSLGITIGTGL